MFVDQTADKQFGFRYYLDLDGRSDRVIYNTRTIGQTTDLGPSSKVTWGGKDIYYDASTCYLQYLRIYWDYLADSQNHMINLAIMDTDGGGMISF